MLTTLSNYTLYVFYVLRYFYYRNTSSPAFFACSSELWLGTLFRFPSHRYIGLLFPLVNKSLVCTLFMYFSWGLLKEMELSLSDAYPHPVIFAWRYARHCMHPICSTILSASLWDSRKWSGRVNDAVLYKHH